MKLKQLKLRNFRCYREETVVELGELVVFVGRNDAGKSTLFEALDIFFENKTAPDRDDVSVNSGSLDVQITCVFSEVPSSIVIDAQHETDLASEYLLNGSGLLEITKVYNCGASRPRPTVFARAVHPTAENYGDLLSLNNAQLKRRATTLDVGLDDVNQSVNAELRRAIWLHSLDLEEKEVDVELRSDAAKIWDQLKQSMPVYALFKSDRSSTDQDAEAQDPMKAAVKEAIKEQQHALNEITERVIAEVQGIADRTVEKLQEMNPDLASQLKPRVSNRSWDSLFSVNLTGDEEIPINKRGSGTRRLVLMNFFRAKSEQRADGVDAGLIYAIEEPETSQHPHNQVMLIGALEELVAGSDCQVFISTHTPVLARRFNQDALRLVTNDGAKPVIKQGDDDETVREIVDSLGVLPDHDVKGFLCVEGKNDINFLTAISRVLHESGEHDIPDLGQEEDEGRLVFVPLGGSNLELWVSKLEGFGLPEIYLVDRDDQKQPKYQDVIQRIANNPSCITFITHRKELENYLHPDVMKGEYVSYSGTGDAFEDVPLLFAQAVHEASGSNVQWGEVGEEKRRKKESNGKLRLNRDFVAKMTPDLLSTIDTDDEVRTWLRAVGAALQSNSQ